MYAPPKITSIDWGIKLSHISDHLKPTHPPIPDLNLRNPPPNLHPPPHTSLSLSLCGFHLILADFMLIEMTPNNLIHTCRSRLSLCQIFNAGCFHTNTWKLYYIIVDWQTFVKETLSDTIWRGSTTLVEVSAQSLAAMLSTSQQTFRFFLDNLAKIGGLSIAHEQIWCFLLNSGA